jgi:hypothetical protein
LRRAALCCGLVAVLGSTARAQAPSDWTECLGAHGAYFDMEAKYARLMKGDKAAFLGSEDYRKYVADAEEAYRVQLAKQQAGK